MTRFDCTRIDELLMDFLYEELGREDDEAVRAHLDGCARCARAVRELSGVREAARELPRLEPPPALSARLLHQAALARRPSWWTRAVEWLAPRRTYSLAAAVASLAIVLFVGYAMQKRYVRPTFDRAATTSTVTPEAEGTAAPLAAPAGSSSAAPAAPAAPPAAMPKSVAAGELIPAEPAEASRRAEALSTEAGSRDRTALARPAEGADESGVRLGLAGDKRAAKKAGEFPVRLDGDSVRRERAGADVSDLRNVERVWDASPQLRKAPTVGAGPPPPETRLKDREKKGRLMDFAEPPAARAPAGTRGHADTPAKVEKPAADNRALGGAVRSNSWARPAAPTPEREVAAPRPAAPRPAAAAAPAAPPPYAPSQPPSYKKAAPPASPVSAGQAPGRGAVQAPAPRAQRQPAEQLEEDVNAREEKARVTHGGGGKRGGETQATTVDDGVAYRSADAEYFAATKLPCGEKAIKLLEQFVRDHPRDARVEAARLRGKVCRDQLSGQSYEMDQVIQQQAAPPARQQVDAERRAPAKAGRKPAATVQQQRAADKQGQKATAQQQRPATKQQGQKAETTKAAKAKAAAKPAAKSQSERRPADAATAK